MALRLRTPVFAWVLAMAVGLGGRATGGQKLIPKNVFPPLPGKIVGLILVDPKPILALEGRVGPPGAVCFSTNGSSYRWLFVKTHDPEGDTINFPVAAPNKTMRFEGVALASPAMLKSLGIPTDNTLVEVEVNGGEGARSDQFLATHIRVVEGSPEFPLKASEVIARLKKKHVAYVKDQTATVKQLMQKAQREALPDQEPTGPRETEQLCYASWLNDDDQLRVTCLTTITNGRFQYAKGVGSVPPETSKGTRYGIIYGVRVASVWMVDAAGEIVSTKTFPIESFQEMLPPPPGGVGGEGGPVVPPPTPP